MVGLTIDDMVIKHFHGFTLIELIMTMAIGAIVLSIAVPSFQTYTNNNRKLTSVSDLTTALNLARSTAITRRVRVTLCKSADGAICKIGGGSGNWSQGWMMFTNPNNIDATAGLTSTEELLRVHGALPGNNISFKGNNNVINKVSFSAQGLALGSGGTITYCDTRGANGASALVISVGGQVRRATDSSDDTDKIVDVEGVNVSCPTL
jgi:type IV fimbrial biogenesis protein FimT